jgi:hypothetical protein
VGVAVTEPAEDVEDEDAVLHGPTKVTKGVSHGLHLAAELADREVTLDEGLEVRIKPQSPGLGVAQKLALERQPGLASIRRVADEVVEVEGDRPDDPREDDAVKAQPRGGLGSDSGIGEDVIVEGVAAEGEEDHVPPTGIGGRLGLENHRDEQADVLDPPGLVVQLRHERVDRVVPDDRGGGGAVARRAGGGGPYVVVDRRDEALLHVGDLAGQGVGRIPLALPGEGGRTKTSLTLSGCSTGSDEGSGERRGVTTGVEVG